MNYRSVAQLNKAVIDWSNRLPRDFDLIAGLPRSGLLPATMLALHRNLPLTDLDGLVARRLLQSGARGNGRHTADLFNRPLRVLVIDDSLLSGKQFDAARQVIATATLPYQISSGAVFIDAGKEGRVDYFAEVVPAPRVFEWNVMHNPVLSYSCVDIDGVLCRDPAPEDNDDGPRYLSFIESAAPYLVPTVRIGWVVTSRIEKYRQHTQAWLARNGITYGELIMLDLPDQASRVRLQAYGSFKAEVYQTTRAQLFIESSINQAIEICERTGMSVWCAETRDMVQPGTLAAARRAIRRAPARLPARINRLYKRLLDRSA